MYAAYPLGPLTRYSPYLLLKYHCHLNVEVYKYYLKYLYTVPYRSPYRYAASKRPGDVGSFFVNLGDL